jgi:hypothetical protein
VQPNGVFRERPIGTKVAKNVHREGKMREGAAYVQAKATEVMAAATMRKAALLEDHNMLLLMTNSQTPKAQEYLRLRQAEELKKLRRRLANQEQQELEAQVVEDQRQRDKATREIALAKAQEREDLETRRQMEGAHALFDEDEEDDDVVGNEPENLEFGQADDDGFMSPGVFSSYANSESLSHHRVPALAESLQTNVAASEEAINAFSRYVIVSIYFFFFQLGFLAAVRRSFRVGSRGSGRKWGVGGFDISWGVVSLHFGFLVGRNWESGVGSRQSEVGSRQSEVGSLQSGVWNLMYRVFFFFPSFHCTCVWGVGFVFL